MVLSTVDSSKAHVDSAQRPASAERNTPLATAEPKAVTSNKFHPPQASSIRQVSTDLQYRKNYIKNQLIRLILDTSHQLKQSDTLDASTKNLLSVEKNAKFILSLLAQDSRTNSHFYKGGTNVDTDSGLSITRSVEQTLQRALPNGKNYKDIEIYPKEQLVNLFKNEKSYQKTVEQLASLFDRPNTRVQLIEESASKKTLRPRLNHTEQVPSIEVTHSYSTDATEDTALTSDTLWVCRKKRPNQGIISF